MFEHLDDPLATPGPPTLDRDAVVRRGRALRRRRRLVAGASGTLACVVLAAAGGWLYVDRRDAAIDRVDVSTQPSTDGAVNVLLVGADGDLGEGGSRADTIAVLRLDGDGSARVLFVPRDLWDPVAGNRINQALQGGQQAMVDAVETTLGIPVDHYVELGFTGFEALVDAVGGLHVSVADPVRDRQSGLDLDAAPCATLDGRTALALARSRHLEVEADVATWTADPTGDLGRIDRARIVVAAAVAGLAEQSGPADLDRLSRLLADHAVVDDGLSLGRLADLGRRLVAAGTPATDTLPVAPAMAGQAAVLQLAAGAPDVLAAYGATAPPSAVNAADAGPATSFGAALPIAAC